MARLASTGVLLAHGMTLARNAVNQVHNLANQPNVIKLGFDHPKKSLHKQQTDRVGFPVPVSQCPLPAINTATSLSGSTNSSGTSSNARDRYGLIF